MFKDRVEAGRQIASALEPLGIDENAMVLALPRGGIVLGEEVSREFNIPLGVILVRKISHPFFPEYAVGAVVEHDKPVYGNNEKTSIDRFWLAKAESHAYKLNAYRREFYFGGDYLEPEITNKTVILVDDGIATGLTMMASILSVRNKRPKRIIVAVPVASSSSLFELSGLADEFITLYDPARFKGSVGAHYLKFDQVDDEKVRAILRQKTYESPPAAVWR